MIGLRRHLVWTDCGQLLAVRSSWEEERHDTDEVVIFDIDTGGSKPSAHVTGEYLHGADAKSLLLRCRGRVAACHTTYTCGLSCLREGQWLMVVGRNVSVGPRRGPCLKICNLCRHNPVWCQHTCGSSLAPWSSNAADSIWGAASVWREGSWTAEQAGEFPGAMSQHAYPARRYWPTPAC